MNLRRSNLAYALSVGAVMDRKKIDEEMRIHEEKMRLLAERKDVRDAASVLANQGVQPPRPTPDGKADGELMKEVYGRSRGRPIGDHGPEKDALQVKAAREQER